MIRQIKVNLKKECFDNVIALFIFVYTSIIKYTISWGTLVISLVLCGAYIIGKYKICIIIPVFLFALYVMAALEETYHILMLIILNKKEAITHLDITRIEVGFVYLLGGVSVCYSGKFSQKNLFYISLAGPIIPLFYIFVAGVISLMANLFFAINIGIIGKTILFSVIAPLMSFIPLNCNGYVSDGYRISYFIKLNHISLYQVLQEVVYTIKTLLHIGFKRIDDKG